jgi:hypothetical protein
VPDAGVLEGGGAPCAGVRGQRPRKVFLHQDNIFLGRHITGTTYFRDHMIFRWFFGTWFFADGFLFPVKELGFWTNSGHWVRVLDVPGSYMYIVL